MMTTTTMDDVEKRIDERPGAQLATVRIAKGLTVESIAATLNLRVSLIELLEADDYTKLPNPVFVKGYLRGYAKLLDINPEPLVETYIEYYSIEQPCEKAPLWQSRRDTSGRGEKAIRWITTLFGLVVLVAVAVWWQKSQDNQQLFAKTTAEVKQQEAKNEPEFSQSDIRLTDLSTMRSLLSSENQYSSLENAGE